MASIKDAWRAFWGMETKEDVPIAAPATRGILYENSNAASYSNRTPRTLAQFGYMNNVTVYRAVKVIAESVASIDWKVVQKGNTDTELTDHPLATLLKKPNDRAKGTFIEQLVSYWLIAGTNYMLASFPFYANTQQPATFPPVGLYNLRPDLIEQKSTSMGVYEYEYQLGSETLRYPAWKVNAIRSFHPLDELSGISPVLVAATVVERQNQGEEWNMALMQQMARPSGAFVAKGQLQDTTFQRLKREVARKYGRGAKTAGIPMLLEGDLSYVQMALSPVEADWLNSDASAGRKIATAIGVDPLLLNDKQYSTYNNMREAKLAMWEFTGIPILYRVRDEWNGWLCPFYGNDIEVIPDMTAIEALKVNRSEDSNVAVSLFQGGLATQNEGRQMVGLDEDANGDFYKLGPSVYVLRDDLADYLANAQDRRLNPPTPVFGQLPQPAPTVRVVPNQPAQLPQQAQAKAKQEHAQIATVLEMLRQPFYGDFEDALAYQFGQEKKLLLAALKKQNSLHNAMHTIRNVLGQSKGAMADIYTTYYGQIAETAAQLVQQEFGSVKSIWHPVAMKVAAYDVSQNVNALYDSTEADLEEITRNASDVQSMLSAIEDVYNDYAKVRAAGISQTEVTRASGFGIYQAGLETGLPMYKTWVTVGDSHVRPSHKSADGQRVPLDQPFMVGEESAMMQYPGDTHYGAGPQEFMQCRCGMWLEVAFS